LDEIQDRFEREAIAKGAKTEAQRLEELRAEGKWSDAKDLDIERQRDAVWRFEEGRKSIVAPPSVLRSHDTQIEGEKKKLLAMMNEKAQLIGLTAENYAQRLVSDHYIIVNLFADKELASPMFRAEDYDEFPDSDVEEIMEAYAAAVEPCAEANIRRLAVADFFTSYYHLCNDDLSSFFGKPVCELTYHQVRLGNVARYFKSLMENVDTTTLDPKTRNDPDALERAFSASKAKSKMEESGQVPVGMSASDIKEMGLENRLSQVRGEESGLDIIKRLRGQAR